MLPYLKLCHASIADQGINVEHVVADGGSNDGTANWLKENKGIISVSEKDNGMYNALNKAINMAKGEIIGHLNCDEQYLPETLKFVRSFFNNHPEIDFLAGDFMYIDSNVELLAYRKAFHPRWQYFFSNYLYTNTCTLFYRRKIFVECRFDETYRSIADAIFLYSVLKKGFNGAHVRRYFSVFTYTGSNLSLDPISEIEKTRFNKTLPIWYRISKPVFFILFYIERLLNKTYSEKSDLKYSIFDKGNTARRVDKVKENLTFRVKLK